tara:strand:- start:3665 stop:4306 length:642 start_codon:yes stop_codon:yes gene_type:complete
MSKITLAEKIYYDIEEKIVKLEYKPGSFLTENFLGKNLKCGRTPIREAIQKLAREGLIKVIPRKGLMVTHIDINDQLNLIQVRRELEKLMAKLSAKNASRAQKEKFLKISKLMKKCKNNDNTRFIKLDKEMNDLLAISCDNEFLRRSMRLVSGLSRRFWFYRNLKSLDDLTIIAGLHSAVCESIYKGDLLNAEKKTEKLMEYIEKFTKDSIQL